MSLDSNFSPFLAEGFTWAKKTKAEPLRGFADDFLEPMLGQIANYCPIIARNTLVKNSTSIQSIWNTIRQHFGFQITGAHFIDFADIHLESKEDLYQRLMGFIEDILLKANSLR